MQTFLKTILMIPSLDAISNHVTTKDHLTLHCRKLLYHTLIKPVLEYCCSKKDNACALWLSGL